MTHTWIPILIVCSKEANLSYIHGYIHLYTNGHTNCVYVPKQRLRNPYYPSPHNWTVNRHRGSWILPPKTPGIADWPSPWSWNELLPPSSSRDLLSSSSIQSSFTSVLLPCVQNILQYRQGMFLPYLTDEETDTQSDWVTCLRPQSFLGFHDFTVQFSLPIVPLRVTESKPRAKVHTFVLQDIDE